MVDAGLPRTRGGPLGGGGGGEGRDRDEDQEGAGDTPAGAGGSPGASAPVRPGGAPGDTASLPGAASTPGGTAGAPGTARAQDVAGGAPGTPATAEDAGGSRDGAGGAGAEHGPAVSARRRAAAIAAAIFPGAVVHGAGSWVLGNRRAAKRLLATEAIGVAAAAAGGLPIAGSGSSPYTIWPGVPLVVSGVGGFLSSWLADIWVAAGGAELPARPLALPPWSVEVATTWQHDAYRERALLGGQGHVELGRLGLDAGGYVDAGNASRSGGVGARWRVLGPAATGRAVEDGSRVLVHADVRIDRDDDDRVTLATAEAELAGRLDLDRLDPQLRGSFLELSVGGGVNRTTYPLDRHDTAAILLAGFAWGAYLGDRGELAVFYDHRRDGLAGGLAAGHAAGFVGSFGANTELRVTGPWAVRGQLQVGSAWVTTLGVRYLGGLGG